MVEKLQTQNDTIYKDINDTVTEKENAVTYQITNEIENNIRTTLTYNSSNDIIKIKSVSKYDPTTQSYVQTESFYYTPEGNLLNIGHYTNGELSKAESIDPFTGEKVSITFAQEFMDTGSIIFFTGNSYGYSKYEDAKLISFEMVNVANRLNKVVLDIAPKDSLHFESFSILSSTYYDKKGIEKYRLDFDKDGLPYDGYEVSLNDDDFKIKQLVKYEKGTLVEEIVFYLDGKNKTIETTTSSQKITTTYDKKGKKIGVLTSTLSHEGYIEKNSGIYVMFDYGELADNITNIYNYDEQGELIWEKVYHSSKGQNYLSSQTFYDEHWPTRTDNYNANGTIKDKLEFKQGLPYHGTFRSEYQIQHYEHGLTVSKIVYHRDTEKIFEKQQGLHSTYYDPQGNELAQMSFVRNYDDFFEPYQGTMYTLAIDKVYSIDKYEQGTLVHTKTYSSVEGQFIGQLEKEEFSDPNAPLRTDIYYANGQLLSSTIYTNESYYLEEVSATFYSDTGQLLGAYDYENKDGVLVEFFYNNQISSIKTYKQGELETEESYARKLNFYEYDNIEDEYYLQAKINYNSQGVFYDELGDILSEATYKDGSPYNGTTYIYEDDNLTETTYKNGEINGERIVSTIAYSLSEIKQIEVFEMGEKRLEKKFYDGVLINDYTFSNDMRHGPSHSYDSDGNKIATLIYKEGQPFEGESFEHDSEYSLNIESIYEQGELKVLRKRDLNTDNILFEQKYTAQNTFERTIRDFDGKLIFQFNVKDDFLHGPCTIVYNDQTYHSTLEDGYLIEGTILKYTKEDYLHYEETMTKVSLDPSTSTLTQTVFRLSGNEELFKSTTHIDKQNQMFTYLIQDRLGLTNLLPYNYLNTTHTDSAADVADAADAYEY